MSDRRCSELVQELLADPVHFYETGRAYGLLQAFFDGEPPHTLRPLLKSTVFHIQRVAMFVTSELGIAAQSLIDDVAPLLYSDDRYIQYHAMEVIAVCSTGDQVSRFALVVQMLESDDDLLQGLAMRLMSRVDVSQIRAARTSLMATIASWQSHVRGLDALIADRGTDPAIIRAMARSPHRLVQRYAAIAARRMSDAFPALVAELDTEGSELRKITEWER